MVEGGWLMVEGGGLRLEGRGAGVNEAGVTAGDDGRSLLVACAADNLDVEFLGDAFLLFYEDAVLSEVLFARLERLGGEVLEHLKLIVALADEGTEGDGYGQSYHACSRDADTHSVLQDVCTQQSLYFLGAAAQLLRCLCGTQSDTHRLRTSYGGNYLAMYHRYYLLSDLFVNHSFIVF